MHADTMPDTSGANFQYTPETPRFQPVHDARHRFLESCYTAHFSESASHCSVTFRNHLQSHSRITALRRGKSFNILYFFPVSNTAGPKILFPVES